MRDTPSPNVALLIRQNVFGMTQAQMADAIGVSQPRVSNWEALGRFPVDRQPDVRALASRLGKPWSDSWFFEPPMQPVGEAA